MKRTLIFLFTLIISVNTAKSQAALLVLILGDKAATENFYFSLKGGIGFSNLADLSGADYKLGVHFGLSNNVRINNRWDFVPEFMPLSWKGAQDLDYKITGVPQLDTMNIRDVSRSRNLNYVDIPLLMRYKITDRIRFEFGPQVSILTSARDRYEATILEENDLIYTINRKDELTGMDYGFVLALGYALTDFSTGKGMEFYLRYYEGFQDISKISGESYRNRVFQVSVSFPFILPTESTE